MNALHAYALLVAIAVPVSTLAGLNMWLYLQGERDTLLLPGVLGWPAIRLDPPAAPESVPARASSAVAANEEPFQLAA